MLELECHFHATNETSRHPRPTSLLFLTSQVWTGIVKLLYSHFLCNRFFSSWIIFRFRSLLKFKFVTSSSGTNLRAFSYRISASSSLPVRWYKAPRFATLEASYKYTKHILVTDPALTRKCKLDNEFCCTVHTSLEQNTCRHWKFLYNQQNHFYHTSPSSSLL